MKKRKKTEKPRPEDQENEYRRLSRSRKLLVAAAIFFGVTAIASGSLFAFQYAYAQKAYPGVRIGSLELGGLAYADIKGRISQAVSHYDQKGVVFQYEDTRIPVFPVTASPDGSFAHEIYSLDADAMAGAAFEAGRQTGNPLLDAKDQVLLLASGSGLIVSYRIDEDALEQLLAESLAELETPTTNAKLSYDAKVDDNDDNEEKAEGARLRQGASADEEKGEGDEETDSEPLLRLVAEEPGKVFDLDRAIVDATNRLEGLDQGAVELVMITDEPEITRENAASAFEEAEHILKGTMPTLAREDDSWKMESGDLASLLMLKLKHGKVELGIDPEALVSYLEESVGPDVNKDAVEAKFEISGKTIRKIADGKDGLAIDTEVVAQKLESDFLGKGETEIELAMKVVEPQITTENIGDLGIKELVGVGTSGFAGSSANRIHNIRNGAGTLHGNVIAPGEEFSIVSALGAINGANGYLQGWVIKGDETVLEYGGGLCQIGTTLFRAALDAGFPITERRNHSYIVNYYSPTGTDATIYGPHPDLRFINDTDHHVLIQTHVYGTEARFEFWGTSDGRKVGMTEPYTYNVSGPGPAREILDESMAPGARRCTERARNGADAQFTRTITYADDTSNEETFYSYYVAWPALCYVGPESAEGADHDDDSDSDADGEAVSPEASEGESNDTQPDPSPTPEPPASEPAAPIPAEPTPEPGSATIE